jgi:acyl carrier protein
LEEVEQNIKKIWQEVLGVNSIKNKDNFFRLGGHSLLLIQVYDRLDRLYPNKLNVADLFIFSKVSDLAIFICQDNFELRKRKEKQTSHKNFSTILDQVKSGEKKLEVAVDNLFDL